MARAAPRRRYQLAYVAYEAYEVLAEAASVANALEPELEPGAERVRENAEDYEHERASARANTYTTD